VPLLQPALSHIRINSIKSNRMSDVNALVVSAQSLSLSKAGLVELQTSLDANAELLATDISVAVAALEAGALTPHAHSLAWVHILHAMCIPPSASAGMGQPPHSDPNTDKFLALATILLKSCDPAQVRKDPVRFARVCGELRDVAVAKNLPASAIAPLAAAIAAARPSPDHLTPQHAMLFQCCLLAKCFNAALPVLLQPVYEVDPSTTGLKSRDFLTYCYYGGMCFVGLRRYDEAANLLLHAITAPASAVSAVVVAAFKTFTMTSLIGGGVVPSFPRFTPPVVQRNLKALCVPYFALSDAYKTRSGEQLGKVAKIHEAAFAADGNSGLLALVVKSLVKRNVQRLTQTYLTLSLADIASAVHMQGGAAEAEKQVVCMIEAGEIFASISQRDGMVSFHDVGTDQYSSVAMAAQLDGEIREAMAMSDRVRSVDEAVKCDKTYLAKISSEVGSELAGLRGMKVGGDMDYAGGDP